VLYGKQDRHYPRARPGRFVTLEGGHFAFLLEHERAHAAIVAFLRSEPGHDVEEGVEGAKGH
jgi:hypothetical protein